MKNEGGNLPDRPGVYLFKDACGSIIYVGKASSLKNRVSSYFRSRNDDWKISSLLADHACVDHVVTGSTEEAELLEAHLIRLYQPRYNVLLRDGQPFVYIMVARGKLPTLKIVRNKKEKGTYFGPFLHKKAARSAYDYLCRTLRLKLCKHRIEEGCLDYHVGTCAGTCRPAFDRRAYEVRLELAVHILGNDRDGCLTKLHEQIRAHSAARDFEKAKIFYEYLLDLDTIFRTLAARFDPQRSMTSVLHTPQAHAIIDGKALAAKVQEFMGVDKPVVTIDCFDVSHFQSRSMVGSCVRFCYGIPQPDKFRHFAIKSLVDQDDCAALAEIVARRYRDEADEPDIVLVDGGKGQLSAARKVVRTAPCASLAKNGERLFCQRYPRGIALDIHSCVGTLLMALRDYAHHCAIKYHREKNRMHE